MIPYYEWLQDLYRTTPWKKIADNHRHAIVRDRSIKPEACPSCGRVPVQFFNLSGRYRDDDADYAWMCRICYEESKRPDREYVKPGDKLKPWSQLTRQSKMFRIRRDLPMPATCPYCDRSQVELFSKSGRWLEDPTDYVWLCRLHRLEVEAFLIDRIREPVIERWDPDLFPHWTNSNSMGGSFAGHSILNKTCAGGRFLNTNHVSDCDESHINPNASTMKGKNEWADMP